MKIASERRKEQYGPICFMEENFGNIGKEHDDPIVISALIHNLFIRQMLVDQRCLIDILYSHVIEALVYQRACTSCTMAQISFIGGQVQVKGTITLQVTFENQPCMMSIKVNFFVVSTHNGAYNAILRRPSLN